MQVFEVVESSIDNGSKCEIILLGKKADETTVSVRVYNTPFYVYVRVPDAYEKDLDPHDFASKLNKECYINKKWCKRTDCSTCNPVRLKKPILEVDEDDEGEEETAPPVEKTEENMKYLNTQPCIKKVEYDLRDMIDVVKTTVVYRYGLIGYASKPSKFIQLHLTRPFFSSNVKSKAYEYMNDNNWPYPRKVYGCHNNAVDGFLFASISLAKEEMKGGQKKGISSLTWLDMDTFVPVDDGKRKTTCKEEYLCEFKHLMRLKNPPMLPVRKKRFSLDIECSVPNITRMPDSSKDPIFVIRVYEGKQTAFKFMWEPRKTTEKDMLEDFIKCIEKEDPDIIEGYVSNSFDLFYLRDRMITHKLDLSRLCKIRGHDVIFLKTFRTSRQSGRKQVVFFDLPGRVELDVFLYMKSLNRFADLGLKHVATAELGHTKEDFEYCNINPYFYGTPEQREELAYYCEIDAKLPYELDDKYKISLFFDVLAELNGITFSKMITVGVQAQLHRLLCGFIDGQFLIESPPFQVKSAEEEEGDSYEGATVIDPRKGYYTDPVFVGDFNSLYPSIIITYNLSPETFLSPEDVKTMNPDDFVTFKNGYSFVKEHVKKGVLPRVCETLLDARAEMKARVVTPGDIYDINQDGLKRQTNSIYGGLAAKSSAYYRPEIAATITMLGREAIKKVIDYIGETIPKDELETIYGDTDSVFGWIKKFRGQDNIVKKALDFAYEVRGKIMKSGLFTGRMKLGIEGVLYPCCITAKKTYFAYKYVTPDERKLYERGTVSVRRENPKFIREMFKKLSVMALNFTSKEDVELFVRERVHTILSAKPTIEEMAITKNYTKSMGEYKNPEGMDSMRVVKLYMKYRPIETPEPGDRIKYVLIKTGSAHAKSCDLARPLFMVKHTHELDLNYYVQHKIRPSMTKFLEMLGIEDKVIDDIFTVSRSTNNAAYLKCYNPLLRELQFKVIPKVLVEKPLIVEEEIVEEEVKKKVVVEERKKPKMIQTILKFI